jgi:L-ascorbate 6-phosphate lactonase
MEYAMNAGTTLIRDIDTCELEAGQCAFWWLGQHSFVVKLGDTVCYLDPFLSPLPSRTVAPLLAAEDITNASVVIGTHDHADHIDRAVWPAIAEASPEAIFVTPALLCDRIAEELGMQDDRVVGIDEGLTERVGCVDIHGVPAAHELLDPDAATGLHPSVGVVLEGSGCTVYHSGDTCIYEGMQALLRQWQLDLAFLPINGRDAKRYAANCIGNMTYQEAVDLAGALAPRLTVPAHFEMFAMNSENPQLFMDYLGVKYPHLKGMIPTHGDRVVVDP